MITDYIDGGELFDEIQRRKAFSEQVAADVMGQLLSAIAYCHEKGIVHRDLKPENILIDSSSKERIMIKVADFGTAKSFNSHTKMKTTLGTPYYIAPEVIAQNYTEKCDVWSCGVILYILLSGNAPFNGVNEEEILAAVQKGKFSFTSIFLQKD